jgi:hypothetical protein
MTMTMSESERAERRERQRELADRLKASGALDQIFEQIDAGEVPLGGEDGLLKGMLKAALERGLEVELTDHVGYERGDPEASLFANSRNGTSSKTVSSEVGDVELAVPRDRNGSFIPRLVPRGSRRLGGLDEMIISLYAGGMTVRDIQHHLASTIGTELSHETISKITDQVAEEVLVWQRRPLEALYPVIYLDALVVKVKDGAHVRNKAAHIAVGVDVDGIKHVLGIWVQTSEGARFWGWRNPAINRCSGAGRPGGLPVGDEHLVGQLGLLGDLSFFVASLLVVVGRAGDPVVTATRRGAGDQLELAALVGDQAGSGESVVLIFGDQMPGEDGHLAGGRDHRGVEAAAGLDALVERPQRPGRSARRPGRLNQHPADLGPTGFADPSVHRCGVSGLPHLRVQPDIGN